MIRRIDGERSAFILETDNTSYIFSVLPSGHLEQLYYGKRIRVTDSGAIEALSEKRAFEPGNTIAYSKDHSALVLEDTLLEMSSTGKGDIREPFLEIIHHDGSRTGDFLFKDAEISEDKPDFGGLPGSYSENGKYEHLTVLLEDAGYGLSLELHYFVYPECDVITRGARLRNESENACEIKRMMSLQLDLPPMERSVSFFRGAWAREMHRETVPLRGIYTGASSAGVSSSRINPFFMIHEPEASEESGSCYAFNLIYSGNHYESAGIGAFGKTRVLCGINPQGFSWHLSPGEAFDTPEAVMTFSSNGFGAMSRSMHEFVREHIVRGVWKNRPRPVLLNSWEASYFNFTQSSLISLAKEGKVLGIELFVMDDGWFGERNDDTRSLGDWDPNPKKLPGGLSVLADKIREIGLSFGLWVEPEMVNTDSELFRTHPDWTLAIPGKPHSEGRNQRILDLTNPEVCDFLTEKMSEVFSSADISYVKWDMNRVFSDAYSSYLPADREGEVFHRYVLGLYSILGKLTERFPQILFEGCASGGNRFDLGALCYFPQIWASDNTDAISRVSIQEGYSFGYPLSTVSAHVSASPNHQTLRSAPLDTRFNVAAFGLLGYELDPRDLSKEEKKEITDQIALYKKWRDTLQFGEFYRVRSGNLTQWCCVSKDRSKAVGLFLQKLVEPNTQFARFFARGLKPEKNYSFYNLVHSLNLKRFGSLINTQSPIHIRQDSMLHNLISRFKTMPGEEESYCVSGDLLMYAGIKLRQGFSGTGYDENVRFFQDFCSRLYLMEEQDEKKESGGSAQS
ncbi:MAG: alpha-galactosidase [Clostridia bacterium]|nr:alpha-galactosidase [Clostridia bacterium]